MRTMGGAAMMAAGATQALVEYGVLNSIARDIGMGLQRLGGWATDNWVVTAGVLGVLIFFALRPKR